MPLTVKSQLRSLAKSIPLVISALPSSGLPSGFISTVGSISVASATLLAVPFASFSEGQAVAANEIRWYEDLAPAIHHATAHNLPILLHFYGDNCPPCRLLERKAYKDPQLVGKLNSQVVAVRINAEKNVELRTRYKITKWPQDVYLLPDGSEIFRGVSPQDPAVYARTVDRMSMAHSQWTLARNAPPQQGQSTANNLFTTNQPGPINKANPIGNLANSNPAAMPQSPYGLPTANMPNVTMPNVTAPNVTAPNVAMPSHSSALAGISNGAVQHSSPAISSNAAPSHLVTSRGELSTPKTISFDNLSAPAVVFNPAMEGTPNPQMTNPQTPNPQMTNEPGLPTILKGDKTASANNSATIKNPFLANDSQKLPEEAPNNLSSTSSVPVHMASSPNNLSASTSSRIDPQNIAATPSNPPSSDSVKEASVGLDGYCPVTLFMAVKGEIDQSECWTQGSPKFAVKHRGRIYLCASEDMRQRFLKGPDIYSPCLSGFDLIHYIKTQELVDGKCEYGCFQGDTGRIFLFANQENSNEFRQKEAFYSRLVNTNQPERVANQPEMTQVR